ncbi:hypothetical protein BN1088_150004 [Sphingobacterium sp. PM2-P1-29]|nr:hypothetical protein BN1088_150004 [Sphingobacterium sp. PM2-P1-29]
MIKGYNYDRIYIKALIFKLGDWNFSLQQEKVIFSPNQP